MRLTYGQLGAYCTLITISTGTCIYNTGIYYIDEQVHFACWETTI